MTKSQETLFLLLRCGLWQDKKLAGEVRDADWRDLFRLAMEQCVVGVVADAFNLMDKNQVSVQDKLRWLGYVVNLEKMNGGLDDLVGRLFCKYDSMGLSPVLMKGQAFASNYPYPLHRQCGDIDIYFKCREDCSKAVAWAEKVDRGAADSPDNKRERKHFTFSVGKNIVELHYYMCLFENPRLHKRLQRIIDEEFANSKPFFVEIGGERIETVPPTLSVLHQIIHISRHLLEAGIGLRQICDLALYLDRYYDKIDRDKLNIYLEDLQLTAVAGSLGFIMVNHLGLEEGKLPFGADMQYADFILQEIFEGGNFGKKKVEYRDESNSLCRKLQSVFYFYKRCRLYKPLMPMEAKSYYKNKISLNLRLITKHHY
mgnify:FL=1